MLPYLSIFRSRNGLDERPNRSLLHPITQLATAFVYCDSFVSFGFRHSRRKKSAGSQQYLLKYVRKWEKEVEWEAKMKVWEWDENSEVMLFGGQSVGGTGKNMLNFKAKAASVMLPFLEWGPAFFNLEVQIN